MFAEAGRKKGVPPCSVELPVCLLQQTADMAETALEVLLLLLSGLTETA